MYREENNMHINYICILYSATLLSQCRSPLTSFHSTLSKVIAEETRCISDVLPLLTSLALCRSLTLAFDTFYWACARLLRSLLQCLWTSNGLLVLSSPRTRLVNNSCFLLSLLLLSTPLLELMFLVSISYLN